MGGSHRTLRGTAIPKVMGTGTFGCQRGLTKKAPRFVSWTTDPSDFFPPTKKRQSEKGSFFEEKSSWFPSGMVEVSFEVPRDVQGLKV